METLTVAYIVIVHLLAVPSTLFPIIYSRRSWRNTAEGKAQMVSGVSFAVFIDYVVANYWLKIVHNDSIIGIIIACIIVGGLLVARTYLLVLLLTARRRASRLSKE